MTAREELVEREKLCAQLRNLDCDPDREGRCRACPEEVGRKAADLIAILPDIEAAALERGRIEGLTDAAKVASDERERCNLEGAVSRSNEARAAWFMAQLTAKKIHTEIEARIPKPEAGHE